MWVEPNFEVEELEIPTPDELVELTAACVGFAGRYAVKYLKKSMYRHPSIAGSLTSAWSRRKGQIWIRSWVETGIWGAAGRSLAKRPIISSKILKQESALRSGFGVARKIRNMTQQRSKYENGQLVSRENVFLRDFEKCRIRIGTRINSKGKVVPKYKTIYKVKGGYNEGVDTSGLIKFIGSDGRWKSFYEAQVASRPGRDVEWDNWMINNWSTEENSPGFLNAMNLYYASKLDEMLARRNQ